MNKYIAEFIGIFSLVFIGCGSTVLNGDRIDNVGIALSFGVALMAMIYTIGPISGCHINPAVSIGFFVCGKMEKKDFIAYLISQFAGATAAAAVIALIAVGMQENFHLDGSGIGIYGYNIEANGLCQNGWGQGFKGGFSFISAVMFELVGTFIFVFTMLSISTKKEFQQIAGLIMGLIFMIIIFVGMNVTGSSVNPARSFGPAILVGGKAIEQLWMFLIVPGIAGIISGVLYMLCNKADKPDIIV